MKDMTVKMLKLQTGETILTKVEEDENVKGFLFLLRPMQVFPVPTGIALRPWIPGVNPEQVIELLVSAVIAAVDPDIEVAKSYIEQYHSSIALPTASDVAAVEQSKSKLIL